VNDFGLLRQAERDAALDYQQRSTNRDSQSLVVASLCQRIPNANLSRLVYP